MDPNMFGDLPKVIISVICLIALAFLLAGFAVGALI